MPFPALGRTAAVGAAVRRSVFSSIGRAQGLPPFALHTLVASVAAALAFMPLGTSAQEKATTTRQTATLPVVVTIFDDDTTLFDALAAGARGYVLKGVQSKSLIEQLRRIERGEPPISPQIAHRILAYFRSKRMAPSAAPPRSFTITRPPLFAIISAISRPIPRPAPVTTTTFPSSMLLLPWLSVRDLV